VHPGSRRPRARDAPAPARRTAPTCARRCPRRRTCARRPGSSSPRSREGAARRAGARLCGGVCAGCRAWRTETSPGVTRSRSVEALQRAITLLERARHEDRTASHACAFTWQVPSTVCVESGCTVRTHDAKVLDAVVIRDPVDVVEDERHSMSAPDPTLTTELALFSLQALSEKALLQVVPGVGRVFDKDLLERDLPAIPPSTGKRLENRGLRIKVIGRDVPKCCVLLDRRCVATGITVAQQRQSLGPVSSACDRVSGLCCVEWRTPSHRTHVRMVVRRRKHNYDA
jgi:hypothetical protein